MKDLGLPLRVLQRGIVGLERTVKAAGPAFTIHGRLDAKLDKHISFYERAGLLSRALAGHVVVCQPQYDTRAPFGGLSAEALKLKGVRGYIVDGGCRDIQAVADQGFPVLARYPTPIDIVGAWRAEAVKISVANGGQQVLPHDPVLADHDGIILVGAADVEAVVDAAERKMATEDDRVRAIGAGEHPQAAYLRYRVF